MSTPLTDAINALTAYANSVTGESDTNLSDAVHTLADGYGQGGEVTPSPQKQVNFIDYDGTISHSYTASEALALTELPQNPSHNGLTAQGWNYTLAQIKTEVNAHGSCDVGQMYVTDDNITKLYCTFEIGRLTPYLGICPNGTVVVDWGDGSPTDTLTGTSYSEVKYVSHTYATPGDYVIKLTTGSEEYFAIRGSNYSSYILRKSNGASSSNVDVVYASALRCVELGSGAIIGQYAFAFCQNLKSITMSSSHDIDSYAFRNCYSLKSITIPSGLTNLYTCFITNCYALKSVSIPFSMNVIGSNAFSNCYSLTRVIIPSSTKYIKDYAFSKCYALANVVIPSGMISIDKYAFEHCYGMGEYHLLPTTPPSLSATNAFSKMQSDCIIYVPVGALESYQTANNWSTYASYMREETS